MKPPEVMVIPLRFEALEVEGGKWRLWDRIERAFISGEHEQSFIEALATQRNHLNRKANK